MSRETARGLLIAAYSVLAVAAGARSTVQLATRFDAAPATYLLSAVAAAVYLVAAVALRLDGATPWRVARTSLRVELVGVLVVGSLSVLEPGWFPDQTVWSDYGLGYALVPLVLPALGLRWLRRFDRAVGDTVAA